MLWTPPLALMALSGAWALHCSAYTCSTLHVITSQVCGSFRWSSRSLCSRLHMILWRTSCTTTIPRTRLFIPKTVAYAGVGRSHPPPGNIFRPYSSPFSLAHLSQWTTPATVKTRQKTKNLTPQGIFQTRVFTRSPLTCSYMFRFHADFHQRRGTPMATIQPSKILRKYIVQHITWQKHKNKKLLFRRKIKLIFLAAASPIGLQ